jgi:hypothetical protein
MVSFTSPIEKLLIPWSTGKSTNINGKRTILIINCVEAWRDVLLHKYFISEFYPEFKLDSGSAAWPLLRSKTPFASLVISGSVFLFIPVVAVGFEAIFGDPCHFGADPDQDPYPQIRTLWQMDPNPTPDPTPFFSDFKDAKKKKYFFLITYPQAHYFQS